MRRAQPEPWPLPDFVVQPARPPRLAWALLAVAVLATGLGFDEWWSLREARAEAERDRAGWSLATRPASTRPTVPVRPPAAAAEARAVSTRLGFDWQGVLTAVERSAAPKVSWLRMEVDAERGELRVEGTAPSREAVLQTVDALAALPESRDALLQRVESLQAPADGLRFEVRARWRIEADAP